MGWYSAASPGLPSSAGNLRGRSTGSVDSLAGVVVHIRELYHSIGQPADKPKLLLLQH